MVKSDRRRSRKGARKKLQPILPGLTGGKAELGWDPFKTGKIQAKKEQIARRVLLPYRFTKTPVSPPILVSGCVVDDQRDKNSGRFFFSPL